MKCGSIYGILCPISRRIVYVGQTISSIEHRLSEHKSASKKEFKRSSIQEWFSLLSDRHDKITAIELEPVYDLSEMNIKELIWIYKCDEEFSLLNRIIRVCRRNRKTKSQRFTPYVVPTILNVKQIKNVNKFYSKEEIISIFNITNKDFLRFKHRASFSLEMYDKIIRGIDTAMLSGRCIDYELKIKEAKNRKQSVVNTKKRRKIFLTPANR